MRRAPGGGLGTRWDLPPPWWTQTFPSFRFTGGGIGKNLFCLSRLLGRIKIVTVLIPGSEGTFPKHWRGRQPGDLLPWEPSV